jgi:hypothetical protein
VARREQASVGDKQRPAKAQLACQFSKASYRAFTKDDSSVRLEIE